jgi:hypothetical protein
MQSPDQANQSGLIHEDIGDRGHLAVIGQCFNMDFCFSKPIQPGWVQLTMDFDLITAL